MLIGYARISKAGRFPEPRPAEGCSHSVLMLGIWDLFVSCILEFVTLVLGIWVSSENDGISSCDFLPGVEGGREESLLPHSGSLRDRE